MSYEPRLDLAVSTQFRGLPEEALDLLVSVVADVCTDPYDRMTSMPLRDDGHLRMAELGDGGFIEFRVDDAVGIVHVYRLVWVG